MTLGLAVGDEVFPVGGADVLHAFFSTISYHLEPDGWGSRFPALMHELYQGELPDTRVEAALLETTVARRELAGLAAADVVWDIDAPHMRPPSSYADRAGAPNLSRWFTAPDGRSLFDVLALAMIRLRITHTSALRVVDTTGVLRAS